MKAMPARLVGLERRNPVKLSETPVDYHLPPPYCGQHTDQVLREMLHMSDDGLAALRAKKVI